MAFKWRELPDSRKTTEDPPSITLRFLATGSMEEMLIQAYADQQAPQNWMTIYGLLFRGKMSIDPDGHNRWLVTVPYSSLQIAEGEWTWDYDTTGGSFHIKASKQTVAAYGSGAAVGDHGNLIGVHGDDVDGSDIVIPAMKINVRYRHALGALTLDYAYMIGGLTGMVNSTPMLKRAAGEVLFLGGTGSDGTKAEAEAGYSFAVSPNLQNKIIGGITVTNKDGWDLAWIDHGPDTVSGNPVRKPKKIYIERVYDRANLAGFLGFGGS